MRGKKTTIIEALIPLAKVLTKNGFEEISAGYIRSVKGRKDVTIDVKVREVSGGILLSCTTKRYHQDLRIYTTRDTDEVFSLFSRTLSSERFRVRKD